MTSSCSGKLMAAMTFMGSWQDGQSVGSTNQVFLMSRAQLRFRPLTNGLSSSPWDAEGNERAPEDPDASGSSPSSLNAAAGSGEAGVLRGRTFVAFPESCQRQNSQATPAFW